MCQNYVLPFGKYKGKDLLHVAETEPTYIYWLSTIAKGELKVNVDKMIDTEYFQDCAYAAIQDEEWDDIGFAYSDEWWKD